LLHFLQHLLRRLDPRLIWRRGRLLCLCGGLVRGIVSVIVRPSRFISFAGDFGELGRSWSA
jgi:hypothetical protein